jgi:histidinol-phosphate aminotransferase
VRDALADSYLDANLSPPPVPPLRTALARRHGVGSDQVLVTAGSTEVIDATLRTFARAGDRVVIPEPFWPVCQRRLQAVEAEIATVPLHASETTWSYDVDALIAAVTDETKLIVICTPNNPTGNAMALADIRRIADLGRPLLIDAAYSDFDPEVDLMGLVHDYPHVIVTRTFSKAYCLAGLRVGYAVMSPEVLDYVDRFLVPGSAVSSAALHAGMAALSDEEYHSYQVNRITAERCGRWATGCGTRRATSSASTAPIIRAGGTASPMRSWPGASSCGRSATSCGSRSARPSRTRRSWRR